MLLSITILGFIVTFLLLINLRQSNKVNIYLFFFLFINNIYSLSHYATVYSGNKYLIAIMLVHFAPLYLLLGPLFYFYVRGLLKDDYKLSKLDLLHFIPAIIILINAAPFIFQGSEYKLAYAQSILQDPINILKINNLFFSPVVTFMLRPIFALGYVLATIILIYNNELHESYTGKQSKLIYKWLALLIAMSVLLYLGFLIFTVIVYFKMDYYSSYDQGVFMLYSTIVGLILLNISLLFFPNILYGLPQLDFAIVTKNNIAVEQQLGIAEDIKKQGKGFEISQERLSLLKLKVDTYVEKMPYLNLQFNLTMMSSDTDIPVHHLSYFFNEYMNINFNTWKNDLKIDYVIKKINDGSSEILTLDALAKQAGFGSRSSFINAFKLKTGQTPSEYLQNLD